MRVFAAAALTGLALLAAGCGATSSIGAHGGALGTGAAALTPSDALAFVAVDTDLHSAQWQRVDALTQSFPARAKLLDTLNSDLQKHGLTWKDDVQPALGNEVDVAVLGKSEAVVFTKPTDVSKLRTLADKLSRGNEHYSVEQIAGWSVVADSQQLFDRVRSVQSGQSLADQSGFKSAWSQVGGDALARAYASGGQAATLPRLMPLVGNADWLAARVAADGDALRLELICHSTTAERASLKQQLLGDVPSGSALAVAFHGAGDLLKHASSSKAPKRLPLAQLAPLLSGDGVLYVRSQGLVPQAAIELAPADPQAALTSARATLAKLGTTLGPFQLTAQLSNGKLVISDGPQATAALRSGPKLVSDQTYKDAVAAAGVPAKTTFLAYADVTTLAPFVQLALPALTGKPADPALADNLSHVGTVVAWGTSSGNTTRLQAWIQPR